MCFVFVPVGLELCLLWQLIAAKALSWEELKLTNFSVSIGYLDLFLQKCLLRCPRRFVRLLSKSLYLIVGCRATKSVIFETMLKYFLLRNRKVDAADAWLTFL